jgi:MFS family permease
MSQLADESHSPIFTRKMRRAALKGFYGNGALWGLGNGLVSSSLVVYLAGNYGAKGLAVSLILATPRLVGVLRLATPFLMDWVGNRRRFAVQTFLASAAILLVLPVVSAPSVLPTPAASLAALVICWTCYHLCEFLGVIALWSWIGDAVPRRVRGRFIGKRAALMNTFQVAGMIAGAVSTSFWQQHTVATNQPANGWLGYAACVSCGAMLFALATLPLLSVPNVGSSQSPNGTSWQEILLPFRDRAFLRYLAYGGWFSFANGLPGTAQFLFQMRVLNISYAERLALDGTSQGLQSAVMPWIGRVIDRRGNVPVLVVSQLLVACGMLFLLIATPEYRWWVAGAYVLWIAYAGINVAMPNLVLTLAQRESYAAYAAAWFAWTQLVYALSTLAGGLLFDWGSANWKNWSSSFGGVDHFVAIFVLGFVLRLMASGLAARVPEPKDYERISGVE